MSEPQSEMTAASEDIPSLDRSSSSIRSQLLWASLFPLAFFGLLCMLAFSSALTQMVMSLALERNTAKVQFITDSLAREFSAPSAFTSTVLDQSLEQMAVAKDSKLFIVDHQGKQIAASSSASSSFPFQSDEVRTFFQDGNANSRIVESKASREEICVSFAEFPDGTLGVLLAEPWAVVMAQVYNYELIIAALLIIGIALSLGMLSLSIGRLVRPIATLAEKAARAVPDSIFRPIPAHGPAEIRRLIDSFNHMVIRLAEQQASVRLYAHKALLSQELERERLSHELHDGTLQDLLSLSQRVELCRNELEHDPDLARRRLNELQILLTASVDDIRRISSALRPPVLEDLGLVIALDSLCKDLQQDRPAIRCEFLVNGQERRLQPDLELAVFRVIQEALANIRKHVADATLVFVDLTFDETEIHVIVKNDGAVFMERDVRSLVRSGHLGLAGMYERTRLFGGTLDIVSDEENNTTLNLRMPYALDSIKKELSLEPQENNLE
ncbi:MAG: HAMP domain-containing sensor histidine kinase [Anaerolineaceae bacterium]